MRHSIRTRLTFLITLVYLSVFLLLLAMGGVAVYLELKEDIDRRLQIN